MAWRFDLLEHTSDIGILGRGATRTEALIAVCRGLVSIMVAPEDIQPLQERRLRAAGRDDAARIIGWLNEILFFFDAEGLVLVRFHIDAWDDREITGVAWGEPFDSSRHEFRTAVKAATYHQFDSRSTPQGWEIRVFMDL